MVGELLRLPDLEGTQIGAGVELVSEHGTSVA
jgi:hypothetical protein